MIELSDICEALTEQDGSFRDMNFVAPTWDGIQGLLVKLGPTFGVASARDWDGNTVSLSRLESTGETLRRRGGCEVVYDDGKGFVSHLQLAVFCEEDGSPFVELSFYPGDYNPTEDLRRAFLAWAEDIRRTLQARTCYVRYENESWKFGDVSRHSGVFLVLEE